jgi:hypothetical protein
MGVRLRETNPETRMATAITPGRRIRFAIGEIARRRACRDASSVQTAVY